MIRTFADKRTEALFEAGVAWGVPPDLLRRAKRKQMRHWSLTAMATPSKSSSVTITEARETMPLPNQRRRIRRPTHPGEMLREEYLPDLGLTVATLANALGVSRQSVNELVRERRAVSAEMALRLGKLFGMTPEFWLNLQREVDLWDASQAIKREIEAIQPLRVA